MYTQYRDKTVITDKKAAELIFGYFVRRGTARAEPFPAGARAPVPRLARPRAATGAISFAFKTPLSHSILLGLHS